MSPPSYIDLGKNARDVFGKKYFYYLLIFKGSPSGKGFHFGLVKLEVKNKTESGMSVTSGGQSNIDTGRVGGNLEMKTKRCPGTGVQLTTKWNTENVINTSLSLQDKLVNGLSLTLDSTYSPDTGSKNGRLKAEFASPAVLMALDTDLNLSGPVLNTSAVLGHKVSDRPRLWRSDILLH